MSEDFDVLFVFLEQSSFETVIIDNGKIKFTFHNLATAWLSIIIHILHIYTHYGSFTKH